MTLQDAEPAAAVDSALVRSAFEHAHERLFVAGYAAVLASGNGRGVGDGGCGVSRQRTRGPLANLEATDPIPEWVWHLETMTAALAARDIAAVFAVLQRLGLSQRRIAARTGQSQSEVSEIVAGRHVTSYDVLVRIGDGFGVPRGMLGLAYAGSAEPALPRVAGQCERCATHPIVGRWTGREIRMLRHALRMSVREFAFHLGVSDRMASKWESGDGTCRPRQINQAALDTALARADETARRLFALYQSAAPAETTAR